MTVRDGLLAILTLGPAYGHQLHLEFAARAAHRGPVNVGQIYSTIDRLTRDGLVESAGTTTDALPLHALTATGRAAADAWMSSPAGQPILDWTEILDQLLVTATIDRASAVRLAASCRRSWDAEFDDVRRLLESDDGESPASNIGRVAVLARRAHAVAVLAWLGSFVDALDGDTELPYSPARPKRGRRPAKVVAALPAEHPVLD